MSYKTQDYKSLLLFGASFWTFFSLVGMSGALTAFADISAFWFVPLFFISLSLVSFSARRILVIDSVTHKWVESQPRLAILPIMGGMILLMFSLSFNVFDHVRAVESIHSCSQKNPDACGRAANYFADFSLAGGYSDVAYYRQEYRRFTEFVPARHSTKKHQKRKKEHITTGQLYATCLFGDRQTMIDKMRKRDAFTWFAYSKFGSPQDMFGGFEEGPRTKRSCEKLMDSGLLEHQEVGCTGILELCDLENSDRCEVQTRQCKVVLSSPFD